MTLRVARRRARALLILATVVTAGFLAADLFSAGQPPQPPVPVAGPGVTKLPLVAADDPPAPASTLRAKGAGWLLASALSFARATGWAHVSATGTGSHGRFSLSQISGAGQGLVSVQGDQGAYVVQVAPGGLYFQGGPGPLAANLGLARRGAQALAGQWLFVRGLSSVPGALAPGPDLVSLLDGLVARGPLSLRATERQGSQVLALSGRPPGAAAAAGSLTVYISETVRPLPVAAELDIPHERLGESYTGWGVPASLGAPPGPVPLTLGAPGRYLPVGGSPGLPQGLCQVAAPRGSPPASAALATAFDQAAPAWGRVTQQLWYRSSSGAGAAMARRVVAAEQEADSRLLGQLGQLHLDLAARSAAAAYETWLGRYVDALSAALRDNRAATPAALRAPGGPDADQLLRRAGLGAGFDCAWLRP